MSRDVLEEILARAMEDDAFHGRLLAYTLRQIPRDFGAAPGEKVVILVTDGKEECGGSPSAVVSELVAKASISA